MIEKGFIFFPDKEISQTPADAGLPFEDLYLLTQDGVRINAWFIPSPGSRKVLLWFHGNAGNLSNRVDQASILHQELRINVFMVDFREYGRSEGRVTEQGTYQDAFAAYDYLLSRTDLDREGIVVYGQSLGAAVAVELAVRRKAAGLILEAPFVSIREMARALFPWFPVGRLLSTRYDLISQVERVQTPLLVIHGDRDEVVPYSQGWKVFEAAKPPKQIYTVQSAGHNNLYRIGGQGYFQTIDRFIQGLSDSPDSNERSPD